MLDYSNILSIIATSNIGFIAVIGTFTIFRLEWLRKEIDDYRGRIIRLFTQSKEEASIRTFNVKILEEIKSIDKHLRNEGHLLKLSDDELKEEAIKIICKVKVFDGKNNKIGRDLSKYSGQMYQYNLGEALELFMRRLASKQKILNYSNFSIFFFISIFITSLLFILNGPIKVYLFEMFMAIFIIGLLSIFIDLFENIKNEY